MKPPVVHVHWLVVAAPSRGTGVGRALLAHLLHETTGPVEVVTFGADHPGAQARHFWERLGFTPGEPLAPGPEGGARQHYRLTR
ncbi:GNAT family N-acetyltransferase [Catenuloplanes japonicus]|uniref:GNAT family N-acetyltransferase n=1 Tax=Catenuloplanes japonicus TaxID=33876 RepID=UPI000AE11E1E|nr:GNAT family N-acetyltransferase [Catenuloplanes japonicus]